MAAMTEIPVVDISRYRIDTVSEDEVDTETVRSLADDMCGALRDIGFCYIKNHGIPQSLIDKMFAVNRTFFKMPIEYKNKYRRGAHAGSLYGWIPLATERVNPERPSDYKEGYALPPFDGDEILPDVEDFDVSVKEFLASCHKLTLRLLDLVSIGLDLEDRNFLRKCHAFLGQNGNCSAMKTILYPAVPPDEQTQPNQIRCGEHSDFGTLTLLFQDDAGGLEVENLAGEYIPATPLTGTIVINIGDLMQRWTSDKLIATKHRVVIPEEESRKSMDRQSIAFFIHPDNEVMIECLDKSNKYKPIQSLRYLLDRLGSIY